jgi:hypothetical protein
MEFDVVVVGGGPPGPPRPKIWPAAASACDAGQGGPHQALRRRDPAAPDRRFRHPRQPDRRPITTARMISPTGRRSTSRSRTALSAWSTASISTSSCATAPQEAGATRLTGTFLRIERDEDGTRRLPRQGPRARTALDRETDDRRRRRPVGRGAARGAGRRQDPLRHRLSRDHRRPRTAGTTTTLTAAT